MIGLLLCIAVYVLVMRCLAAVPKHAEYILNGKGYIPKDCRLICATITENTYMAQDGTFFEMETFYGLPLGRVSLVHVNTAKRRVGTSGKAELYRELWGD